MRKEQEAIQLQAQIEAQSSDSDIAMSKSDQAAMDDDGLKEEMDKERQRLELEMQAEMARMDLENNLASEQETAQATSEDPKVQKEEMEIDFLADGPAVASEPLKSTTSPKGKKPPTSAHANPSQRNKGTSKGTSTSVRNKPSSGTVKGKAAKTPSSTAAKGKKTSSTQKPTGLPRVAGFSPKSPARPTAKPVSSTGTKGKNASSSKKATGLPRVAGLSPKSPMRPTTGSNPKPIPTSPSLRVKVPKSPNRPKPISTTPVGSPGRKTTPVSPYSPTHGSPRDAPICPSDYVPDLHGSKGPCERCLFFASEEEKAKFDATGHCLRIMQVHGGCSRECLVYPRKETEAPVRLCKQCYFSTHKSSYESLKS